jgi:hypothetical protein
MADAPQEKLSDETKAADRSDAQAEHRADRMPTPDEERKAEQHELSPDAAESYKEMAERGANQQGEGRIP